MKTATLLAPTIIFFLLIPNPVLADFGCHFIVNARWSTALDDGSKKLSYRFTCRQDITLAAASLYCEDAQVPPGYLIGLYADDKGNPSAEPLGSASIVPQGKNWFTVPFGDLPLFGGRVYHLVVEQDKNRGGTHPVGTIGPNNFASFAFSDVPNHLIPRDEAPDPASDVLLFDGKTWKDLHRQPLYALYGGGQYSEGNPYDAFGAFPVYGGGKPGEAGSGMMQGEALHPHCQIPHTGFAVRVRKQGHPTSPLSYWVYNNDYVHHLTTFSYAGLALTPDQAPDNFQWVTIGLNRADMPKPFEPQCTYIAFKTDSGHVISGDPGCEDCYMISEVGNSGGLPLAAEMSFDGGAHLSRAAYSPDGGKTWIEKFEWDVNLVILGPPCVSSQPPALQPIPTPNPLPKAMP